jgi:NAD(P)-dependent dehydrogenase (short-subunit alcohol dehydrogenase family)
MFGAAGLIAYTSAKSAIEGMTKSLARELGPMKIRVNSIAPGWVLTEKQIERANATDPSKFQAYLQRQCLKEHLEPADIARLALWLASNEARRCTGQTFIVDAGVV